MSQYCKNLARCFGLVQNRHHHLFRSILFLLCYRWWQIIQLALNNNHSVTHFNRTVYVVALNNNHSVTHFNRTVYIVALNDNHSITHINRTVYVDVFCMYYEITVTSKSSTYVLCQVKLLTIIF